MVRAALDVFDALPLQLRLELGLTAPRRVLAAVVGERLLRNAEGSDALFEGLHHQRRLHVVRDGVTDDEAAVVVHEHRHVEPLMLAQQEREDVRLPQLVRRRALEARLWSRRVLYFRRLLLEQALLVKNPPHRRRRHADAFEARQDVSDPPSAKCGVLPLHLHHPLPPRVRTPGDRRLPLRRRQRVHPAASELPDPLRHRGVAHAEQLRDVAHARAQLDDLTHRSLSHLRRAPLVALPRLCPSFPTHLSLLVIVRVAEIEAQVLGGFSSAQTLNNWRAVQSATAARRR